MTRKIFIVCGEHSGDALGSKLIDALRAISAEPLEFSGVGGELMAERGFESIFPLADVAVMGILSILPKLPRITRRVYQVVDAALEANPDIVVIIDSPEFTHPIAKRIRKRRPDIPIIDYVSPTVWAWRPGRAQKMKPYVDHLLALLPFEPEAHQRLGGPACTYVGHPLIERVDWIRSLDSQALAERLGLDAAATPVLVLPGSRSSEVERLLDVFGETIVNLSRERKLEVLIPAVPHLRDVILARTADWQVAVHVLDGETDKFTAFRLARAALAASGTVTLELAISGTPMVVAYRVDRVTALLGFLIQVPSIVLANLVLGENAFPEFVQENCSAENLSQAMAEILDDGPARNAQLAALDKIADRLILPSGTPSEKAARIVLEHMSANDDSVGHTTMGHATVPAPSSTA